MDFTFIYLFREQIWVTMITLSYKIGIVEYVYEINTHKSTLLFNNIQFKNDMLQQMPKYNTIILLIDHVKYP